MIKSEIKKHFTTGDLRGKGGVDLVLAEYQKDLSIRKYIFEFVFSEDRLLAMRAIDAYEKIAKRHGVSDREGDMLLSILKKSKPKEFMWHYVQILGYFDIPKNMRDVIFKYLKGAIEGYVESNIVRVFALQTLFDQYNEDSKYKGEVRGIINEMSNSSIPSIKSRANKLLSLLS